MSDQKSNLKPPWQPGESGNPGGRPKIPDDIKEARKLNQNELERLLNKLIWMPKEQLLAHLKAKETPGYEVLIGNIILKGISGGDEKRAEWLTARLIGKIRDELHLTGMKPWVVEFDGKRIEMGVEESEKGS